MKKQKESSSDDLWVAYWVASKSGLSPEKLLQSKQSKGSWKAAIGSLGIASSSLGAGFSHELSANSPDSRLAEAVVNDLLTRFRLLSDLELSAMRKTGASNQELIIAALIAGKTRQLAGQVYAEAKKGTSWGVLLQRARIDTTQLQKELSSLPGLHGSNSR